MGITIIPIISYTVLVKMKQDNAYKGISWDLVINSIILYFLIEASEYIHPTISAKKKKVT